MSIIFRHLNGYREYLSVDTAALRLDGISSLALALLLIGAHIFRHGGEYYLE